MEITQVLIGLVVAWLLTGVLLGYAMRRRGHDFFLWFALGAVLGPLSLPLAFNNIKTETAARSEAAFTSHTAGGFDVLVALDGSPEANAAMRDARRLTTDQPTSFTFVTVLDYESRSPLAQEEVATAEAMLERAASAVADYPTHTEVLFGEPSSTLLEYASESGKELIVIGSRGRGASERLFGSVARAIVSKCDVPVFVGSQPAADPLPYMSPN